MGCGRDWKIALPPPRKRRKNRNFSHFPARLVPRSSSSFHSASAVLPFFSQSFLHAPTRTSFARSFFFLFGCVLVGWLAMQFGCNARRRMGGGTKSLDAWFLSLSLLSLCPLQGLYFKSEIWMTLHRDMQNKHFEPSTRFQALKPCGSFMFMFLLFCSILPQHQRQKILFLYCYFPVHVLTGINRQLWFQSTRLNGANV